MALCMADCILARGAPEIKHWTTEQYYQCLIDNKPIPTRRLRGPILVAIEDDVDEELIESALGVPAPIEDVPPADSGSSSSSSHSENTSIAGSTSSSASSGSVSGLGEETQLAVVGHGPPAPVALAEEGNLPVPVAHRPRRPAGALSWRLSSCFLFTKKVAPLPHGAFQATCYYHAKVRPPSGRGWTRCTRTLAIDGPTVEHEDACVEALERWCLAPHTLLPRKLDCKAAHQAVQQSELPPLTDTHVIDAIAALQPVA